MENFSSTLRKRYNDLMFEYNQNYSSIEEATGYSRQTITKYFRDSNSSIKLDFILKYFKFINNLTTEHNLNLEYFLNESCQNKNIISDDQLKASGINQESLTNISKIAKTFESNEKYNLHLFDDIEFNYERLFFLNAFLSSPKLCDVLDNLVKLYKNVDNKDVEKNYILWSIETEMKELCKDITNKIMETKNKPAND